MRILLVAATVSEIQPLLSNLKIESDGDPNIIGTHRITVLITGAGMVPTAFSLGTHLAKSSYDLAINAGIAGSFDFGLKLGDVCLVTEDTFAELGAEDGDDFLPIEHLGLGKSTHMAYPNQLLSTKGLKEVNAITVNRIHGNEFSIVQTIKRFNAQIESMEGASFFYACAQAKLPCIQIRAISNYVERRNRDKWKIGLAINNLNNTLIQLLKI